MPISCVLKLGAVCHHAINARGRQNQRDDREYPRERTLHDDKGIAICGGLLIVRTSETGSRLSTSWIVLLGRLQQIRRIAHGLHLHDEFRARLLK